MIRFIGNSQCLTTVNQLVSVIGTKVMHRIVEYKYIRAKWLHQKIFSSKNFTLKNYPGSQIFRFIGIFN
jgi:hypothetical protein